MIDDEICPDLCSKCGRHAVFHIHGKDNVPCQIAYWVEYAKGMESQLAAMTERAEKAEAKVAELEAEILKVRNDLGWCRYITDDDMLNPCSRPLYGEDRDIEDTECSFFELPAGEKEKR